MHQLLPSVFVSLRRETTRKQHFLLYRNSGLIPYSNSSSIELFVIKCSKMQKQYVVCTPVMAKYQNKNLLNK